jgi:homogentisate 1,2-dioxygenase
MGEAANGDCASLAIAVVPKGTVYRIDDYDGNERVMTVDEYDWQIST